MLSFEFFAARRHANTRSAFAQQRFNSAIPANLRAPPRSRHQDRLRQQPRVHRSFVRQPSRRAHRRAQLGFQRPRRLHRNRFDRKPQLAILLDHLVARTLAIAACK